MRRASLMRLPAALAATSLFVAACGGGAQPAATTAPTSAPKPTSAAPAAASPATAASPAAKPAPSPVASPAAAASPNPAAAAAPAGGSQLNGTTIKIMSSLPRTGSSKGQTDTIVNSYRMKLQEVANRVGGATLTFEDLDDATAAAGKWTADKEAENANKAVNDPDTMVYLGTFNSGAAAVSIPILCRANLVMISPANTYPGLTKAGEFAEPNEPGVYYPGCARNYTRVVPSDEIQGSAAAQWMKTLGATKVYVLDDTELYGHGIAIAFKSTADKIGLQVVGGPEGIDPKASDYRALAQKIRGTGADAVYFGGITQNNAGKLWQDIKATLGPNVKMMGPDGIQEQAFVDAAGQAAEGTYATFGGVPAPKLTGKGAEWYTRYKDQFKAEPEPYASYGYEAMSVALDAILRAGRKDRAAIRDAVLATKDFDGILGRWSFLPSGDTSLTTMTGQQVRGGKFDAETMAVLQAPQ